jgi:WD40 repeat protein
VKSLAFSPDGILLASASFDNRVKVWDVNSGQERLTFLGHTHGLYGIAYSPDGRCIASSSSAVDKDCAIKLWDPGLSRSARVLKGHTDQVRAVQFSPDGQWLVSVVVGPRPLAKRAGAQRSY